MEKESKSVGLEEDAINRARWRVGVGEISVRMGYKPGLKLDDYHFSTTAVS